MKTDFVFHPENDILPYTPSEEKWKRETGIGNYQSTLFELSSPFDSAKPNSRFWLRCFKCGMVANLGDHEVQVVDGIITINPSILCPRESCQNHYFIKNGEIV